MMKRKSTRDISISEMLHLRNVEGLSNAEIAQRLGMGYSTVCKYLGKQPAGIRKPTRKKVAQTEPAAEQVAEQIHGRKTFTEMLYEMRATEAAEKFQEEHGINAVGINAPDAEEPEVHAEPIVPDVPAVKPADVARQMHERLMREKTACQNNGDITGLIEELKMVFGVDAVSYFLACRVWELRSGKASGNAEQYIAALKGIGGLHM